MSEVRGEERSVGELVECPKCYTPMIREPASPEWFCECGGRLILSDPDRSRRDRLLREAEVTPTIDACTAFEVGRLEAARERSAVELALERSSRENKLLWERLNEIRLISTRRLPL